MYYYTTTVSTSTSMTINGTSDSAMILMTPTSTVKFLPKTISITSTSTSVRPAETPTSSSKSNAYMDDLINTYFDPNTRQLLSSGLNDLMIAVGVRGMCRLWLLFRLTIYTCYDTISVWYSIFQIRIQTLTSEQSKLPTLTVDVRMQLHIYTIFICHSFIYYI